jgi:hypothetical protein
MRSFGLALAAAVAVAAVASGHTAEQARTAIEDHVRRTLDEGRGLYSVVDVDGRTLALEFVHVGVVGAGDLWKFHDPERQVGPDAFFACMRLHAPGEPAEQEYDVDVLVEPRDGKLAVTDVRMHREKRLVSGRWVWEPRSQPAAAQGTGGR